MLKLTAQSSGTVECWMCGVAMIDKPVRLVQGSAMIDGPYQQPIHSLSDYQAINIQNSEQRPKRLNLAHLTRSSGDVAHGRS
jgi:hypothetical protein